MEIKKGPWTREEDHKLLAYIQEHGHGNWRALPLKAGLQRCGKSCRLRWINYLSPHIKRGKFSAQEDMTIIRLHALLGNRWSSIATYLPKRTDNEIKNYWNTRLKKRLARMGIDPATHKPKSMSTGSAQSSQAANISHMAQWETARLEAEARLVRESKIMSNLELYRRVTARPPSPKSAKPRCLDVLNVWKDTTTNNSFFSLESPTSTLNFSSNNSTVQTAVDHNISLIARENSGWQVEGNLGNPLNQLNQATNCTANDFVNWECDMPCLNNNKETYDFDMAGAEYCWNELLNLVTSSPTKSYAD